MKNYLPKDVLRELQILTGRDVPDPNTDDYDAMIDQLKASEDPQHHRAAMLMESKVKITGKDPREKLEKREKWANMLRGARRTLILSYDGMENGWVFSRGKLIGWVALLCALGLGWMFSSLSEPTTALAEGSPAGVTGGAESGSGGGADTTGGETLAEGAASAQSAQTRSVNAEATGDPFAGFGDAPLSSRLGGTPTLPVGSDAAGEANAPYEDPTQASNPYDPYAQGEAARPSIRLANLNVAPGRRSARVNTDGGAARRATLSNDMASAPRAVGGGLYVSPAPARRGTVFAGEPRRGSAPLDALPALLPSPQDAVPNAPQEPWGAPQSGGAVMPGAPAGYMNVFQSVGSAWQEGAPQPGGEAFIDNTGNPYDPATVTPQAVPMGAPDYAVGDSVKATLEVGPVIVEGGGESVGRGLESGGRARRERRGLGR